MLPSHRFSDRWLLPERRNRQRFCGFALCVMTLLSGCGESFSPAVTAARRELQFERAQEALDQLSAQPVDDSAEAHYLKALALEKLERTDAAKAEAKLATERSPKNAKYAALAWRLKLFDGDQSAIEPLLQLRDENPQSAAVSLFAVYAYQAKHVRQRTEGKVRAARVQLEKAEESLKTALSLAREIPECHRELTGLALWFEQPTEALKLLNDMLRDEADNVSLLRDKVKVLILAKQPAEAIQAANQLFKRLEKTESAAVEFANTLSKLAPSPAVLESYSTLREQFPANTAILLRHCWALGKSSQEIEACKLLGTAFEKQTDARRKRLIAQSAVAIPLETLNAEVADEQLKRFRNAISDGQMLAYFEGQLAFLQKNYGDCFRKMQQVIEIYQADRDASRELAQAALRWMQRLVVQEKLAEQIRKAAELTLRRAGLNRFNEADLKDDARSLLHLLEAAENSGTEEPPAFGRPEGDATPSRNPPAP